ncbi:MAG: disulfide bond formation protein B [Sphingomonas sp.]|uniref:disulfide bond formation protein B n=1 Tax=Sphingomonas sp. TaxID=28214 RepID=UPI001AC6CBEC|nr:disulfide bond formation protein B [Sphingomonas sp.]MBN8808995.1 disulfide bond formation protein B [Sphingomonas sp.]
MGNVAKARALALAIPAALLAGAWGFQLIGHLYPCEMCHWQRWPHYTALVLALLAFVRGAPQRLLVALAAVAILVSGAIGIAHAGVEYHWWQGFTACTQTVRGTLTIDDLMKAPIVRCDAPQWTFHGISLAGFNAILSIVGGLAVLTLLLRRNRRA